MISTGFVKRKDNVDTIVRDTEKSFSSAQLLVRVLGTNLTKGHEAKRRE